MPARKITLRVVMSALLQNLDHILAFATLSQVD